MDRILDWIDSFREWSLNIFDQFPLGERLQDIADVVVDWLVINASS